MEAFESFFSHYPLRAYSKGEVIVTDAAIVDTFQVVVSGFVKSYAITAQGDQNIIGFDTTGGMFPISALFAEKRATLYFYEAFTDCEVRSIPRKDMIAFGSKEPRAWPALFEYLLQRQAEQQMHIHSLEQPKAADKVLFTLAYLVERFGRQVKSASIRMPLPLTQQDFAGLVGLTRETTGTQLKHLERQGILQYHQQQYIVHVDKLRALLKQR